MLQELLREARIKKYGTVNNYYKKNSRFGRKRDYLRSSRMSIYRFFKGEDVKLNLKELERIFRHLRLEVKFKQ